MQPIDYVQRFTREERLFLEKFLESGNLETVSVDYPSYTPELCQGMWSRPHIREELELRLERQDIANSRQRAQAKKLHDRSWQEAHAVDNVENSEPGTQKSRAIETAMVLVGRMTRPGLELAGANGSKIIAPPSIYRTMSLQRVTETITQTESVPEKALPAVNQVILDWKTGKPIGPTSTE